MKLVAKKHGLSLAELKKLAEGKSCPKYGTKELLHIRKVRGGKLVVFNISEKYRGEKISDQSEFKFNEYRPHDDRRLNITLQCLDLSMDINDVVEICTLLHGQSSREVFGRYFQWGLTQRRKQDKAEGKKLKLFYTKRLPLVVQ